MEGAGPRRFAREPDPGGTRPSGPLAVCERRAPREALRDFEPRGRRVRRTRGQPRRPFNRPDGPRKPLPELPSVGRGPSRTRRGGRGADRGRIASGPPERERLVPGPVSPWDARLHRGPLRRLDLRYDSPDDARRGPELPEPG